MAYRAALGWRVPVERAVMRHAVAARKGRGCVSLAQCVRQPSYVERGCHAEYPGQAGESEP